MEKLSKLRKKSEFFEKELLNRIVFNEHFIPKCLTLLKKEDFSTFSKHFETITKCYKDKKNISEAFSEAKLNFSDFVATDTTFRNVEVIARDLKDVSNAIKLYKILNKGVEELPYENIKSYIANLQKDIAQNIKPEDKGSEDISGIVNKYQAKKLEYQQRKLNGDKLLGVSTGFDKIDEVIDGLRKGHLWVIGGYTNRGKTTFTLNIVANLIKQNKRVVFYSLEMDDVDIFTKLLGIMSKENGNSIIKGYTKNEERVNENIKKIIDSNLSIHTGIFELSEILYSMYEENVNNPATVFVIDFVQNISVKGSDSEYNTITNAILELQQCAKRLDTPIIALSQISNEGARNASEVMSFKGSGAIASAADLAIEIGIDQSNKEQWTRLKQQGKPVPMEIDIRKNRHGRTRLIDMEFEMDTGIFTEQLELGDI